MSALVHNWGSQPDRDLYDSAVVNGLDPSGLLGTFNLAGLLVAADVHVARRLADLGRETDATVQLAVALAVRAPRVGHVHVDLATIQATAASEFEEEVDIANLPWPDPETWVRQIAASPLVADGDAGPGDRPLRLVDGALYLDRYWRDEVAVARDLNARASVGNQTVDRNLLSDGLRRLFPGDSSGEQRWAAATAVIRNFAVIAGGPGTGKTTTVARLLALFMEQAEAQGAPLPLVALAAPTGKAAARMEEAVREAAVDFETSEAVRQRLLDIGASTIHRLLVRHPGNSSRFRHDSNYRLPHDIVIVDETSMVSLWLMARLTDAVRPDAHLVLVGDPEQLASVEAGAVLADIVGPAAAGSRMSDSAEALLAGVTGSGAPAALTSPPVTRAAEPAQRAPIGDGVVVLQRNHRFGGLLASLAAAIQAGAADAVIEVLQAQEGAVNWVPIDVATADEVALESLKAAAVDSGVSLVETARSGDGAAALVALGRFRVLCAHRRGPAGVSVWNPRVESWVAQAAGGGPDVASWYVGRPVVVTANDYSLRLYNGDTGIALARPDGGIGAAFNRAGTSFIVSPSRLSDVDTVFAMTVHKAQGSEFDEVAVLLPEPSSRILTRELLYTAVTRARGRVQLFGSEESVRTAVGRPIARASGLARRLWSLP